MCTEGVCTHGSKDNRTHQNLFSRDSKVSIGTDRGRMCNIVSIVRSAPEAAGLLQSHRNGHLQSRPCTPTDGRSGTSHSDRRAAQAEMPRNREVPRTREERGARPAPNRSRRGLRPISARKWTDLEAEYDRSRRQGRQGRRDYQCPSGPGRCAKGLATGYSSSSRPRRKASVTAAARESTPSLA